MLVNSKIRCFTFQQGWLILLPLLILLSCNTADIATAELNRAIDLSTSFIENQQLEDGSWQGYKGTLEYPQLTKDSRIFHTLMVLNMLSNDATAVTGKAKEYINNQLNPDGTLNYDGTAHDFCCGKTAHSGSWLPPDFDDTALAGLLVAQGIHGDSKQGFIALMDSFIQLNGLYPSFMVGYYPKARETKLTLPGEQMPSIGVNINVMRWRHQLGLPNTALCKSITELIAEEDVLVYDPYYPPHLLLLWAYEAIQEKTPCGEQLLEVLLRKIKLAKQPKASTNEELAIYILVAPHTATYHKVAPSYVDELVSRQNEGGDWDSYTIYYDGGNQEFNIAHVSASKDLERVNNSFLQNPIIRQYPEIAATAIALNLKLGDTATASLFKEKWAYVLPKNSGGIDSDKYFYYYATLVDYNFRGHYSSPAVTTALCRKALQEYHFRRKQ